VNVIDSSAWLGYFAGELCAEAVAVPLREWDDVLVPSIVLTEVFKIAARQRGTRAAVRAIVQMRRGRVIPLDESLAIEAAQCGLEFKLPLADSVIYATARHFDALLWTRDADFRGLAGVEFLE